MRIQRLDLTRYGKFTDRSIVFGERQTGFPDFHIVYGPNEAGKSTSMAAILDLFFGIGNVSKYSFLHDYKSMRIGALIDLPDGAREVVRVKRNANTLLDVAGQPLPDLALGSVLGSLSRDAYRAMFSLDDETLEEGGESILASQGDLGQLLFSASAGLAGFSKALIGLRQQTDAFTKPLGRGTELAALKDELAQLTKAREDIDIRANDYAKLVDQKTKAIAAYQLSNVERAQVDLAIETLEKQQIALPLLREFYRIRQQLAPLSTLPEVAKASSVDVRDIERQLTVLSTQIANKERRIGELNQEVQDIEIDVAALEVEPQLEAMSALVARNLTADIDIPKLEISRQDAEREVAGILHILGQKDHPAPASLILNETTVTSLRSLILEKSVLDAASAAAEKELAVAAERLEDLPALGENTNTPLNIDASRLASELGIARAGDHDVRVEITESACRKQSVALKSLIAALVPWNGDLNTLATMVMPTNDKIMSWKNNIRSLETAIQQVITEQEKTATDLSRWEAEYTQLSKSLGPTAEFAPEQTRAARDAAWNLHQSKMSPDTADAFETAMRKDDQAWAARFGRSTDFVRLNTLASSIAVAETDIKRLDEKLASLKAKLSELQNDLKDAWSNVSPDSDPTVSPEEIEAWCGKRVLALQAFSAQEMAKVDFETEVRKRDAAQARLIKVLGEHGLKADQTDLVSLLAVAQAVLDQSAHSKLHQERREELERNLNRRQQNQAHAKRALEHWQTKWDAACRANWFGFGVSVEAVANYLEPLGRLSAQLNQVASISDRIEKMRNDQKIFTDRVTQLASTLNLSREGLEPGILWGNIQSRIRIARLQATLAQEKSTELQKETASRAELRESNTIADRERSQLCSYFSVETLDEVHLKLSEIASRDQLRDQLKKLERQICDTLQSGSFEAAEAFLADLNPDGIALELAQFKTEKSDLDLRLQELYATKIKAEDRLSLVGGDDEVARIEEKRRTILLDIEDRAINYVKLRSGILAAEQALRAYREEHRSAMMQRASEAFKMVSRGAYSGLSAQPSKDSEILIAIAADGSSKLSEEMSKGTRFQLYLALRMAGYHEFSATRGSVPFIADDIMETFDDFRAEETFRLFADMANVGQVIYFTHHRHLCEIAKNVSPGVQIHNL